MRATCPAHLIILLKSTRLCHLEVRTGWRSCTQLSMTPARRMWRRKYSPAPRVINLVIDVSEPITGKKCFRSLEHWGRGLESDSIHGCDGWSPVQGVLPNVLGSRNSSRVGAAGIEGEEEEVSDWSLSFPGFVTAGRSAAKHEEDVWGPEQVCVPRRKKTLFALSGTEPRFLGIRTHSLLTIPTETSQWSTATKRQAPQEERVRSSQHNSYYHFQLVPGLRIRGDTSTSIYSYIFRTSYLTNHRENFAFYNEVVSSNQQCEYSYYLFRIMHIICGLDRINPWWWIWK
jgi:hypothetical protein